MVLDRGTPWCNKICLILNILIYDRTNQMSVEIILLFGGLGPSFLEFVQLFVLLLLKGVERLANESLCIHKVD